MHGAKYAHRSHAYEWRTSCAGTCVLGLHTRVVHWKPPPHPAPIVPFVRNGLAHCFHPLLAPHGLEITSLGLAPQQFQWGLTLVLCARELGGEGQLEGGTWACTLCYVGGLALRITYNSLDDSWLSRRADMLVRRILWAKYRCIIKVFGIELNWYDPIQQTLSKPFDIVSIPRVLCKRTYRFFQWLVQCFIWAGVPSRDRMSAIQGASVFGAGRTIS